MSEQRKACYEAMFLIGQAQAADLAGAVEHIRELLRRADAEVLAMRKWDERRLAYEIEKQRRGVYVLTYFKAPTGAIARLERDCNLSETILRVIILRVDHMTEEEMIRQNDEEKLIAEARMRTEREAERRAAAGERVTAGAPDSGDAEGESAALPPEEEGGAEKRDAERAGVEGA